MFPLLFGCSPSVVSVLGLNPVKLSTMVTFESAVLFFGPHSLILAFSRGMVAETSAPNLVGSMGTKVEIYPPS